MRRPVTGVRNGSAELRSTAPTSSSRSASAAARSAAGVRAGPQHRPGRGRQHEPGDAAEPGREVRGSGALGARARARAPGRSAPARSSSWSAVAPTTTPTSPSGAAPALRAAASSTIAWAVLRAGPTRPAAPARPPGWTSGPARTPRARRRPRSGSPASSEPKPRYGDSVTASAASGAPTAEVGVRVAVHRGADVAALDVQDGQRRRCRRSAASTRSSTAMPREPCRSKNADCGLTTATCPASASHAGHGEPLQPVRRRRSAPTRRAGPGAGRCPTQSGPSASTAAGARAAAAEAGAALTAGLAQRGVRRPAATAPRSGRPSAPRCPARRPRRPAPW